MRGGPLPYASQALQRPEGRGRGLIGGLRLVFRQLGFLGVAWVLGLVILFGAIGWQILSLDPWPRLGLHVAVDPR